MTALMGSRGTGQAGQPTWWASLVVRSASLPLPSEHRWRYRQEFLAELYGMTPAEQLHHAGGVLSRVVALRVALNEPARLTSKEATMAAPWRCQAPTCTAGSGCATPKAAGTANAWGADGNGPALAEVAAASAVPTPPVRHSSGRLVGWCPPGTGWPGGLPCPWPGGRWTPRLAGVRLGRARCD